MFIVNCDATYGLIVIRGFILDGSCKGAHIFHAASGANSVIFALCRDPLLILDF